jgi:two-component system sensor histidine kinase DegS
MDLWAVRQDGTEFPIDIKLSPVQTDEGELVIGSIRDITEQKRLQTELEETHRRLFESIEAERLLLSQELHDGPIQELYGIELELESIKSTLASVDGPDDSPAEGLEELDTLGDNVQAIIQTLRTVCSDLRPPVLNQFGLEKAIRSHLSRMQEAHPDLHITTDLTSDGNRLPERTRLALFRVYQNAFSNVVRHAQAVNINVKFKLDADLILLQVQDDGRGFVKPKKWVELVRAGHFGLAGIIERIEALGGEVAVESAPGKGTTIRVELPMTANVD